MRSAADATHRRAESEFIAIIVIVMMVRRAVHIR